MDNHPYRTMPEPKRLPEPEHGFIAWMRRLWTGDDGFTYAVVTEPSIFRTAESKLCGPFTRREAIRYGRRFVSANPHGEARITRMLPNEAWPPPTNWEGARGMPPTFIRTEE